MAGSRSSRAKAALIGGALPTMGCVAVLSHGCKGPTQMTLDIRTNVVCTESRCVDIVAASEPHKAEVNAALVTTGPRFPDATTSQCEEGAAPRKVGTLVITPSGDSAAVVVVTAFGSATLADCVAPKLAPQCIIARRRFTFVENKKLAMPILLDPECAGVPCNESSTCVGKKCVDSHVECTDETCGEPGVVGADGGVIEVDGSSPLVDSGPNDDGSIPVDSGGDGSIASDGGKDGGDASASDAGTLTCSKSPSCLPTSMGSAVACLDGACCYVNGGVTCSTTCPAPGHAACCRDANDCGPSESCCASTKTLQADTQFYCRDTLDCKMNGREVCSAGFETCRSVGPCNTGDTPYLSEPEFFTCS